MGNPKSDVGLEFVSGSVEETHSFGERLGRLLQAGDVAALIGELGTGKTTLIQGIARGLGFDPERIKSPTFVLMREYPADVPLVHVDGYRLEGLVPAASLDTELIFSPSKVTLIEWAQRFEVFLPQERVEIYLAHVSTNRRRIRLVSFGQRAGDLIKQLAKDFKPQISSVSDAASCD